MASPRGDSVLLSVLDTSPIVQGSTARQALRNSLELARTADELGYHRYWVPEHHGMRGVASTSPAVLVGRIADATRHLRVGAGGVLLPNHSPLVVAEQFGTLDALHPERVDLGLGRAPGGPPNAVEAVRSSQERAATPFPEQVDELLRYFSSAEPVVAVPAVGNRLPIWILGSSHSGAQVAGRRGLPYAFAHHLDPGGAGAAVRAYTESFRPSEVLDEPRTLVSVSVIASDTDDHAEWLAGSTRLKVLSRHRGNRILLPSPEESAARHYTEQDRADIAAQSEHVLVGSPETVRAKLQAVLDETGTQELMVTTPVYRHADRVRSYELLRNLGDSLTAT